MPKTVKDGAIRYCDGYQVEKINGEWKYSHVLIYEKYNNCKLEKGEIVIFLDKNKKNLSPNNLYKITKAESAILNRWYRDLSSPKEIITAIAIIRLKQKRIELAKELGLTNSNGRIIEDARESNRKYTSNPEVIKHHSQTTMEWRRRKKIEDPEWYAAFLERNRERRRLNKDKENAKARERRQLAKEKKK